MPGIIENLYDEFVDLGRVTSSQILQVALQQPYVTKKLTDYTTFGLDGGFMNFKHSDGRDVRPTENCVEIIKKYDQIIGIRMYDSTKHQKLSSESDFYVKDGKIVGVKIGGEYVPYSRGAVGYDMLYEAMGSLEELTNGTEDLLQDKSTLYNTVLEMDENYSLTRGKTRKLTGPSELEIVEVPRARGANGFLRILDPSGYDIGRGIHHTIYSLLFKGFDYLLFKPFVDTPIDAINAAIEKKAKALGLHPKKLGHIQKDPFLNPRYKLFKRMTEGVTGVHSDIEEMKKQREIEQGIYSSN